MSTETWAEQLKRESRERAESLIDEHKDEEVKVQGKSYVDHKCSFCKKIIPSGRGLVRVTKKIYTRNSDTPFYNNKYYCNMECKEGKIEIKEKEAIPIGFEIVS
jgi:ribosomal protein L24E